MSENNCSDNHMMGAIPNESGTTFRVWAPFAEKVYVSGTFNDWSRRNWLQKRDDGIWESNVSKAKAGDEYKFILVNGEQEMERIDPYAQHVTNSVGNGIIAENDFDWENDEFSSAPLNELVIYELHVGTFLDDPGGPPGHFSGVIERLPYLQELGINAIQLMPPAEFPGGHSWGYNPAHIFAVESDYGGPKAFKELVKAAHQHGIAVILDVVYNHFGPGDLDLWRFDGWSENNKGGIYFYNDSRAETPWGATRPDYGRPQVRQFILDNVEMWLDEYHIDGLRFDATAYMRNLFGNNNDPLNDLPDGWQLLRDINELVRSKEKFHYTIAEDLQQNEWITKELGAGGAGFHAQWASEFVHPIREALIVTEDHLRDLNAVTTAIRSTYNGDAFERVIYTESHDEVANGRARLPEDIHPGQADSWFAKKRSMLGAGLVFTTLGIPMIFQGQEFLEDQWFRDQDPLDWSRTKTYSGVLHYYRDLIALRRNQGGRTSAFSGQFIDVYHVNNQEKVLAFARWSKDDKSDAVVVIANFANQQFHDYCIGMPGEGEWQLLLNSDSSHYDADFGNQGTDVVMSNPEARDGQSHCATLSIAPYTIMIFAKQNP